MTKQNLLPEEWKTFETHELRLALANCFGGPGQYNDDKQTKLYLPLAGATSKIAIQFKEREISCVELGESLDLKDWQEYAKQIESALNGGQRAIGRGICFSFHQTFGHWRGLRSGIQILPAPSQNLPQNQGMSQHPFIIEFPFVKSEIQSVTWHRYRMAFGEAAKLLNLFLVGRVTQNYGNGDQLWHVDIGQLIADEYSSTTALAIDEIVPENYAKIGIDTLGMRVPSNLDELVLCFFALTSDPRKKFALALHWFDMATRCWNIGAHSLSFAALVSAVEALTNRGIAHNCWCDDCKKSLPHEVPGATERFRIFLERFAPRDENRKQRTKMYELRSMILHGSNLMLLDMGMAYGWDPPLTAETELHRELFLLTRTALHNWLMASSTNDAQGT